MKKIFYMILSLVLPFISHADNEGRSRRITPTVQAVAGVLPSVVNLSTEKIVSETQGRDLETWEKLFGFAPGTSGPKTDYSLGSGSIIDNSGLIVTSAHVVNRATKITVTLYDGSKFLARKLSSDELNDIALLQIIGIPEDKKITSIKMAAPGDLLLGESVIAVGNPYGLGSSISKGVLSAVGRKVVYHGETIFNDILQTDAAVYPGNSGGPLINLNAEMIGVSAAIHKEAKGISFAIPLQRVENTLSKWLIPERFRNISLGIVPANERLKDGKIRIYLQDVIRNSPAWKAGLRPGMNISGFNGEKLTSVMPLCRYLWKLTNKDEISLMMDNGKTINLQPEDITLNDGKLIAEMRLGISVKRLTIPLARALDYPFHDGVIISSPGEYSNKVKRGELLVQIGDVAIHNIEDIARALRNSSHGNTVPVGLVNIRKYGDKYYLTKKMLLMKLN